MDDDLLVGEPAELGGKLISRIDGPKSRVGGQWNHRLEADIF